MSRKTKEKRVTVGVQDQAHKHLVILSDNTGISMRKLVDMAIDRLICDPPTVVIESEVKKMNPSYECPVCEEWVEILPTTPKDDFLCPWCQQRLRLDADAEFVNGSWRDLSKLVTFGSHWDDKV